MMTADEITFWTNVGWWVVSLIGLSIGVAMVYWQRKTYRELVRKNDLDGIKIPMYVPKTKEELEFSAGQANETREQFMRRKSK